MHLLASGGEKFAGKGKEKEAKSKAGYEWGRLRRIVKEELETFGLTISRCTIRDEVPLDES